MTNLEAGFKKIEKALDSVFEAIDSLFKRVQSSYEHEFEGTRKTVIIATCPHCGKKLRINYTSK